jgi:hypothetical protein
VHRGQSCAAHLLLHVLEVGEADARDHLVLGEERRKGDQRVDGDPREGRGSEYVDALRSGREVLPRHLKLALVAHLLLGRVRSVDHKRNAAAQRVPVRVDSEEVPAARTNAPTLLGNRRAPT